jgi:hypothetical protein
MKKKILAYLVTLAAILVDSPSYASMIYGYSCVGKYSGFDVLLPKNKPENIVYADVCTLSGVPADNTFFLRPKLAGVVCEQMVESHDFESRDLQNAGKVLGVYRRTRWAIPDANGTCNDFRKLELVYVEGVSADEFLRILQKAKDIFKKNESKFSIGKCVGGEVERLSIAEIKGLGGSRKYQADVTFESSCPEQGGRSLKLWSPAAEDWHVFRIMR